MGYTRDTAIRGTTAVTVDQAMAYAASLRPKRPEAVRAYAGELWRLCAAVGFDPVILLGQSAHETAGWSGASPWWPERLNPAGLGITGDPGQNAASPTFATGADAARAQVVHMFAYAAYGEATPAALRPYFSLDPRFNAVIAAGFGGAVRVIGDLGNGKWAVDPEYAAGIVRRANEIAAFAAAHPARQEGTGVADVVFGRVPYPAVIASHLPASNPWVKTSGAPDVPEAVVWHRMVGTFRGTDGWFHGGNAATCYGIGCAATDGQADAGRIFEWIAPGSGWYGESSGPVSAPYGDGLALVNKVGVSNVNRVSKAIEVSGDYDTPLDEACRAAIVSMTAYWADQAHIPHDQFPIVPGEDRSYVVWHQEITIGSGKVCPGRVLMYETPALIARVAAVLKHYQVDESKPVPKPPEYAESELPEWWEDALAQSHPSDATEGGRRYWVMRRNFEAVASTRRLASVKKGAKKSGPSVAVREKVFGERLVQGDDGKAYVLTNDGHAILASKLTPRVTIASR